MLKGSKIMESKLRVLIVEDSEDDALLMKRAIRKGGYNIEAECVETAEKMKALLEEKTWDVILSDYNMPHFSGLEALKLVKEFGIDIPFIIISGTIGEETAVEAMKAGAHDYVMKNNMQRLLPAIEREMRESKNRFERKLLEQQYIKAEANKESDAKYHQIFDNIADGIFLLEVTDDSRFRNLEMNSSFLALTGIDREFMLGKCIEEVMQKGNTDIVNTRYLQCFETGQPIEEELELDMPDGKHVFLSKFIPIRNNSGRVYRIVGITQDITKRKQAEMALRESEALYRSVLLASPDAIVITDMEGNIQVVSPMAKKMFGYEQEELVVGRSLFSFLAQDDVDRAKSNISLILQGIVRGPDEYRGVRKDGSIFDVEVNREFIRDAFGQPTKLLFIVRDITRRKQSEEKISILTKAVEQSPLSVVITDGDGFIEYVNPFCLNNTGYTLEEMIGQNPRVLKSGTMPSEIYKKLWDTIKSGNIWRGEICNKKKNGSIYWERMSIAPVSNNEGNITHFIGVKEDITEYMQAETEIKLKNEELLKLNAEKDKFFSIIAHDLRSPFSGFLGLTELMAEKLPSLTMDEVQLFAQTMRDSATNLFRLLENLLEWARMQQGLIPFNPRLIKLTPVVDECISMVVEAAKNKEIEVIYNIPANLRIFADSNMLHTIIRNLVSNAVKFTHKGGKINISAKTIDNKGIEISIKDTGIGMNSEMSQNLFKLGVRTNRKGTEGEESTGLGLVLCKEFIEKHTGRIWVESEVEKGTTFYFTIP